MDENDEPIKIYFQEDIKTFARVFTGWALPGANFWLDNDPDNPAPIELMFDFDASSLSDGIDTYHDSDEKVLFTGDVLPANQSATQDLVLAIDAIYAHQNLAPFISEQLIQRLVTSNPSRAYVARVAAVFVDDGFGIKGNLAAVVRAILLDDEALLGADVQQMFGKYKEPTLIQSQLMRLFHGIEVAQGFYAGHFDQGFLTKDAYDFSQSPLRAPSVFNYYRPNHYANATLRELGLRTPELQIYSEDVIANILWSLEDNIERFNSFRLEQLPWIANYPLFNFNSELDRLNNEGVESLVNYLDLYLCSGHLPSDVKQEMGVILGMAVSGDDKKYAVTDVVKRAVFHPCFWIQY